MIVIYCIVKETVFCRYKNYKIKTNLCHPEYDAIHDFSVCLKTSSNPADIIWFQSHTAKD